MKSTSFAVLGVVVALFITGCNSFSLSPGIFGEKLNIQKRAILSGTGDPKYRVCAEPSPDAMSAMAMEGAGKGGVPNQVSAELSAALQQSAAFVGLRTTSIQLLRDFGYRLCEAYLSKAIDEGEYELLLRRFQKNVVALLAIEQLTGAVKAPSVVLTAQGRAETAQSLSEQRDIREQISKKITDLEKDLKKKESDKTAANADPKALEAQIADIDAEIKRQQKDLEAIDKSIATARGTLAEGQTVPTIQAGGSPSPLSDEAVKVVARAVENIAMAIVESDDIVQLCLMTVRGSIKSKDASKNEFAAWCQKEIEEDQKRRIYRAEINTDIAYHEGIAADEKKSTEEKRQSQEKLKQLYKKKYEAEKTQKENDLHL